MCVKTMNRVMGELNRSLIQREREVKLMVIGLIARENVLFVGPPGTGKSMMVDGLITSVGAKGFNQLMHKFLPPEEVLGPVMLSKLKNDEYERIVKGMLPEAEVAFLDEIWKCSPALLDTMLKILNERRFRNGTSGDIQCPLHSAIAASNEWPIGDGFEGTGALFDRFLVRASIEPVGRSKRRELMFADLPETQQVCEMSDVEEAQRQCQEVHWSDAAADAADEIIDGLFSQGIIVGDRRTRLCVKIAKAEALLNGHDEVEVEDLEVLKHVLWQSPEQERKTAEVVIKVANPDGSRCQEILMTSSELINGIKDFQSPDAFSAVKKIKAMMSDLEKMEKKGNTKARDARDHISQQMVELQKKMLGV